MFIYESLPHTLSRTKKLAYAGNINIILRHQALFLYVCSKTFYLTGYIRTSLSDCIIPKILKRIIVISTRKAAQVPKDKVISFHVLPNALGRTRNSMQSVRNILIPYNGIYNIYSVRYV